MLTKVIAFQGIPIYHGLSFKKDRSTSGIYIDKTLNSLGVYLRKEGADEKEVFIGYIKSEDRRVKGSFVEKEGAIVAFDPEKDAYTDTHIPVLTNDMMIHTDPNDMPLSLLKRGYYQYAGKLYHFDNENLECVASARFDLGKKNTVFYDPLQHKAVAIWVG